jgi:D-alanyl-lipoteichoic acid acyltransferase DltB (MBOAT superfamily)
MRFAAKIVIRFLIGLGGMIIVWMSSFDLHHGLGPTLIAYGFLIVIIIVASRYSKRETRRRGLLLAAISTFPFASLAALSFPSKNDGIVSPFAFWALLSFATLVFSYAADAFLAKRAQNEK